MRANLIWIFLILFSLSLTYQNCSGTKGLSKSATAFSSSSPPTVTANTVNMAEAQHYRCLSAGGRVRCSGGIVYGNSIAFVPFTSTPTNLLTHEVSQLSAGISSMCYVHQGQAYCWGNNSYGAVGDGTFTNRAEPSQVTGMNESVRKIGAGYAHTCVLTVSGKVKCWGFGYYGRLGSGATQTSATAIDVVGLESGVTDLFVGTHATCAVQNQNLKCWGNDIFTNQTPGTSGIPDFVATPTTPVNFTYTPSTKYLMTSGWLITLDNGIVRKWGIKSDNTRALGEVHPGLESNVSEIHGPLLGSMFCVKKSGLYYCPNFETTTLPAPDTSIPTNAQITMSSYSICYYSGSTLMCKGADYGQFGTGEVAAPAVGSYPIGINRPVPIASEF